MPLQSSDFVMVGLGVDHDVPVDPAQPRLADGVHLRWTFKRDLGFPWHGFTLFRRPHESESKSVCVTGGSAQVTSFVPPPTATMTLPEGTFSSDTTIVLTDDFPPAGIRELDLAGRSYLRFTLAPAFTSHAVRARIGFRGAPKDATCVDFEKDKPARGQATLTRSGVHFTVRDAHGAVMPWIVQPVATSAGSLSGLRCGWTLEIVLPYPVREATLRLTRFAQPAKIEAFDHAGKHVAAQAMHGAVKQPESVQLSGDGIARIVVHAPADELFLHELCFSREKHGTSSNTVRVTALLAGTPVATTTVTGAPGTVVDAVLAFDAITAVELSSADAALVELCFEPIAYDLLRGWQVCPRFSAPLCLPVTHPDYPCSGNAPVDEPAARARALARILYGPAAPWTAPFTDLHAELIGLVTGGPGSTPMAARTFGPVAGVPSPPDPGAMVPALPAPSPQDTQQAQSTLDMVLLATLHPAVAQMLGMYWADRTAAPGVAYDYLIVADYAGIATKSNPNALVDGLAHGVSGVYGWICYDLVRAAAPPLAAPSDVRAYALAGATRRLQGGGADDASNVAGLRWNLDLLGPGMLAPGRAVMYNLWRTDLANGDTPAATGPERPAGDGQPIVATEPVYPPGVSATYPDGWPPFALYALDSPLDDGWYAFHAGGIDIFGRYSARSAPAVWYEWAPVPDPRPWYYLDPPGDTVVHPSAVRLLSKVPPPPPVAVEAYALDPLDPTLVKDARYDAWFASLSNAEQTSLTGLRVRWIWSAQAMLQAPRTREFRIYYSSGRPNAVFGRITAADGASGAQIRITTDIADAHPPDTFAGAYLRVGTSAYPIVGSDAAPTLRLTVTLPTAPYGDGTADVANASAQVTGHGTAWHAGMVGLAFQLAASPDVYTILNVTSPTALTLTRVVSGATANAAAYSIYGKRPAPPSACNVAVPPAYAVGSVTLASGSANVTGAGTQWSTSLVGQTFRVQNDPRRFRVVAVASSTQLTLDAAYTGPSGPQFVYAIVHPLYVDMASEHNWEQRFAVVPAAAFTSTVPDPSGGTARIYDVLLPAAGDAVRAGVPLAPTLADPIAYARVGVSAADDRAHATDDPLWDASPLGHRFGNEGAVGGPATIFRVRRVPPPPPVPPPDSARVYATPADYLSRSYYTYRWSPSPHLRAHVFRAVDDAVFQADWKVRPRPALDATQLAFFPDAAVDPRWDASKRTEVSTELNALNAFAHDDAGRAAALAAYRALSNDGLRVLAGLPGNETAFTQITTVALDPDDPANANRVGPDNPPDFVVDPNLRAYVDTLDGRAKNRYFYRSAYADSAQNRSPLGLSGPPVWLVDIVAPRMPVFSSAIGGDRSITLQWASNREPNLASYALYRTDDAERARDLRLMTQVHAVAVAAGDPAARPAAITFADAVPGLVTQYYRLVAVDANGNASPPAGPLSARAHDEALPVPPVPVLAWIAVGTATKAQATWTAGDETMLQRRTSGGGVWQNVGAWRAPGTYAVVDDGADPARAWDFRLRARKATGATAIGAIVALAKAP